MNITVATLRADYVEIRTICPFLYVNKVTSSLPLFCAEEGGSSLGSSTVGLVTRIRTEQLSIPKERLCSMELVCD